MPQFSIKKNNNNMVLKHFILPVDHFKANLFFSHYDPPPLPPKPRLPPVPPHALRSTQSDVGMPPSRGHHNDRGHHPRDSGYSVSFV